MWGLEFGGALNELAGEFQKGLAAFGGGVKHHAGHAVAGRFGQAHIARDHGVKHLVAKVRFELLADLVLQGDARIEHDAQQANDLQILEAISECYDEYKLLEF